MPVGVSSQQNRIWNMEWNEATVQNGVPMQNDEIIGYDTCVYHSRIWASSYTFDIITFVSQLSL